MRRRDFEAWWVASSAREVPFHGPRADLNPGALAEAQHFVRRHSYALLCWSAEFRGRAWNEATGLLEVLWRNSSLTTLRSSYHHQDAREFLCVLLNSSVGAHLWH